MSEGEGETTPLGDSLPVSLMFLLLGRLGGVVGGSLVMWFSGVGLAVVGTGGGVAAIAFLTGGLGGGWLLLWKDSARALTFEPLGAGMGGPDGLPVLDCLLKPGLGRGGRSGPGADIAAAFKTARERSNKKTLTVLFHFFTAAAADQIRQTRRTLELQAVVIAPAELCKQREVT